MMEGSLSSLAPCRFVLPKLQKVAAQLGMFGMGSARNHGTVRATLFFLRLVMQNFKFLAGILPLHRRERVPILPADAQRDDCRLPPRRRRPRHEQQLDRAARHVHAHGAHSTEVRMGRIKLNL